MAEDREDSRPTETVSQRRARPAEGEPPRIEDAEFQDTTESVFDKTTRRVPRLLDEDEDEVGRTRSVATLRRPGSEPKRESVLELSPEFLAKLRELRRKGADAAAEPFGKYELLGTIGTGGTAEVRLAAEPFDVKDTGRLCVIKRIIPDKKDSPELTNLFAEESRVSACLNHPNIVQLYDSGVIDGNPFLAFELIDGVSIRELQRLITPSCLPLKPILEIGLQAADGLAHAHSASGPNGDPLNVVHRDVTPQNILLARNGGVKLADFGIAKFEGRERHTKHGHVRGKLGYLAPEQCRFGPYDHRVDIFALGLVLTELISGRRVLPPTVMVIAEIEGLIRTRCGEAEYPVPQPLEDLLVEMTRAEADQRLGDAAEVVRRLQNIILDTDGPSLAEFGARKVFSRLMPLELMTIIEPPTRRVGVLPEPEEEDAPDDEDDDAPRYSSTVRALSARPDSDTTRRVTPLKPETDEHVTTTTEQRSSPALALVWAACIFALGVAAYLLFAD